MQIQNTYKDRYALLSELNDINNARDIIFDLKWARYDECLTTRDDTFQLLDSIFYYLYDLACTKLMIYDALTAVAADS